MQAYLDANIVIYLVEQPVGFGQRAQAYVSGIYGQGGTIVISDLHRMECRVRPLALHDARTLATFENLFNTPAVLFASVSRAACERAAAIRARYRFPPMDSLHLAVATEHGCERFVTNDAQLTACQDIVVELLP